MFIIVPVNGKYRTKYEKRAEQTQRKTKISRNRTNSHKDVEKKSLDVNSF